MFQILFRRPRVQHQARALYESIIRQARESAFYARCGVPDTLDGRFDLIVLHAFLMFHRLKRDGEAARDLAQALFDLMFADMDASLREMGVGDLSVGRRVKQMAEAFYGRAASYDAALAEGEAALCEALRRNLYGTTRPPEEALAPMASYLRREAMSLAEQDSAAIAAGRVAFGPPPG